MRRNIENIKLHRSDDVKLFTFTGRSNPRKALKSSYEEWLIMKLCCMYLVCICVMERYVINYYHHHH